MRLTFTAALVGSASFGLACDIADFVVEHGVIDRGEGVGVDVPARAAKGETFIVGVVTSGSCIEAEITDITYVNDDTAIVEPFDRRQTACAIDKLCAAYHQAQVAFDTAGDKVILFRGRSRMITGNPPEYREVYPLVDVRTTVLVE